MCVPGKDAGDHDPLPLLGVPDVRLLLTSPLLGLLLSGQNELAPLLGSRRERVLAVRMD